MKLMIIIKNGEKSVSSSILVNLDIGTLCFSRNSNFDATIDFVCGGGTSTVATLHSSEVHWSQEDLNGFWDRFCAGLMCLENCNFDGIKVEIDMETLGINWVAFDKKDNTYKIVKLSPSREGVCCVNYTIHVIFKDRLKLSK